MEIEKFCAVCGQSINIDLQYRQKINTICPNCESQTEWFSTKTATTLNASTLVKKAPRYKNV